MLTPKYLQDSEEKAFANVVDHICKKFDLYIVHRSLDTIDRGYLIICCWKYYFEQKIVLRYGKIMTFYIFN